jgi:predicted RecA/RadA family phage recombinase
MRNVVSRISVNRAAAIIMVAVFLCLVFAAGARAADGAVVIFRAGAHGTLTVTVDGEEIASGDTVEFGKRVIFTAIPDGNSEYNKVRWWLNGVPLPDGSPSTWAMELRYEGPMVEVVVSFERESTDYAIVTFRAGPFGTLTAVVDGRQITSGDSVGVGKRVVFTAVPAKEDGKVGWIVNGEEITDYITEYMLPVQISDDGAPLDVVAFFEVYEEPPGPLRQPLSGVLTFGPSPVRAGGDVAIFWEGNKEVAGELIVLNNLGGVVNKIPVSGMGRIGAWNTRGAAHGSYMVRGVLKDVDGLKCRVLMLVGVVR